MSIKSLFGIRTEKDHGYEKFEGLIRERIKNAVGPLFTTNATGLWEAYLSGIPGESKCGWCACKADESDRKHAPNCPNLWGSHYVVHSGPRQHYNCSCCRRFIERYGGLVTIGESGGVNAVCWLHNEMESGPDFFTDSVLALERKCVNARVTGVFLSSEATWGTPVTKSISGSNDGVPRPFGDVIWTHLSGSNPSIFTHPLKTAEQMMAEKAEDFKVLERALTDYSVDAISQALTILKSEHLDRSEKAVAIAEWFLTLVSSFTSTKHELRRANLMWRAVATAPPGFCHLKNEMLGTLLDDLKQGMPFETVKRRWAQKVHPLQYQRPTALSEGNIEVANKVFEKLKATGSLERRFAKLEDILPSGVIWAPAALPVEKEGMVLFGGVFDHLRQRVNPQHSTVELPMQTMTWVKFRDQVLPNVLEMEFQANRPHGNVRFLRDPSCPGPYFGMVTAANPDAPPILQWDGLDVYETVVAETVAGFEQMKVKTSKKQQRNPASWYFWHGGSTPAQWGLTSEWVRVNLICRSPAHWQQPDKFQHHGEMAMLILDGARETRTSHGGLFPECLRSEYREAKRAIEANSAATEPAGKEEGTANGYALQKGQRYDCVLRVRTRDGMATYRLDRWD